MMAVSDDMPAMQEKVWVSKGFAGGLIQLLMAMSKGMPAMQQKVWVSEVLLAVSFICDGCVA